MRPHVVSAVLALVIAHQASAQDSTGVVDAGPNVSPAFGVHYGSPMRVSGALGLLIDRSAHRNDGLVVMVEPGTQGNEISAGYFRMLGHFGSGFSLRAAVVRTGDEPWNASPNTTYVGAEAHWMLVFGIGGRLGYLRRWSRSVTDPHDNLASIGVSIGG